jgi:membrane protease YdiL (CAAX protease family)
MPKPIEDNFLIAYQTVVMLISLSVGVVLLGFRFRGPLLRFRPRTVVPWNAAAGAVLAVLLVTMAVLGTLSPQKESGKSTKDRQEQSADDADDSANAELRVAAGIVEQLVIVGGTLFLIVTYFNPSRDDLGLPANFRELGCDVLIGVVAIVAAIAPVFIAMLILSGPEMKSEHPLIKMVSEGQPDLPLFIISSLAAVVVAPICEELMFRLLLQGWLEKCEARWRGLLRQEQEIEAVTADDVSQTEAPLASLAAPGAIVGQPAMESITLYSDSGIKASPTLDTPHGWVAIVISAALFGLAHLGYGPEPIPLFFLALVLGYLYNRTHRIVPSIVAHALFNAYSMIALWRMVFCDHAGMQ